MAKLIRVLWAIQKELHTIASCMEPKKYDIYLEPELLSGSVSSTSKSKRSV